MQNIQKRKIIYWSKKEESLFNDFIKREKNMLYDNFYQNLKSQTSKKKSKGFFRKMSIYIGSRNPNQCKSKFQKSERRVFVTKLKISVIDYEFFLKKRKIKSENHRKKIQKVSKNLKYSKIKKKKQEVKKEIKIETDVFNENINYFTEKTSKNSFSGTLEDEDFKEIFFENDDFINKKKFLVKNINTNIDWILRGFSDFK